MAEIDKLSRIVTKSLNKQHERKQEKQKGLPIPSEEIGRNKKLFTTASEEEITGNINALIADYLTMEGYENAAEKFREESEHYHPSVQNKSLTQNIRIIDAINGGRIEEAIARINLSYPNLLGDDRLLNFHLQQLTLIELIRHNELEEALAFAQTHFVKEAEGNPSVLDEIERTMALFAFEDPIGSPFGDLLQLKYRESIAEDVHNTILRYISS